MQAQPTNPTPLTRILAKAHPSSVHAFEQAALELVTEPVYARADVRAAQARLSELLEQVPEKRLRHELEDACSQICARAVGTIARAWLHDLGWIAQEGDEQ